MKAEHLENKDKKGELIKNLETDINSLKDNGLGITFWQIIVSIGAVLTGITAIIQNIKEFNVSICISMLAVTTILIQIFLLKIFSNFDEKISSGKNRFFKFDKNVPRKHSYYFFKIFPLFSEILLLSVSPHQIRLWGILVFSLALALFAWIIPLYQEYKALFAGKYPRRIIIDETVMNWMFVFAIFFSLTTLAVNTLYNLNLNSLLIGAFLGALIFLADLMLYVISPPTQIKYFNDLRDDLIFNNKNYDDVFNEYKRTKLGITIDEYVIEKYKLEINLIDSHEKWVLMQLEQLKFPQYSGKPHDKLYEEIYQKTVREKEFLMRINEKIASGYRKLTEEMKIESPDLTRKEEVISRNQLIIKQTDKILQLLSERGYKPSEKPIVQQ